MIELSTLHVIGLGPGNIEHLTLGAYRIIQQSAKIYVRTMKHPIIDDLLKESVKIEAFDWIYEKSASFEEVYMNIAEYLIKEIEKGVDVVYAVPGHPLFAEKTVEILIKMLDNIQDEINILIHSSMSFLDVVMTSLKSDPIDGLKLLNATSIKDIAPDINIGNMITQVYDRFIASEVKLALLQYYSGDKEIVVLNYCGMKGKEELIKIPLYQLDHLTCIDYLTTIYIPPEIELNNKKITTLLHIMKKLRSEDGCPWDREQNHQSLKRYLIEETYEVIEAIDTNDPWNLVEELGDLLLQIVFHCQIGHEHGIFDFDDVVEKINEKLIYRHPHVFEQQSDYHESKWEELKRKEKGFQYQWEVMGSIPKSLPTLYLAEKVQKKAKDVGFDWDNPVQGIQKIIEESNELKEALKIGEKNAIIHEVGDLLFSVVNVSRLIGIDPDEALHTTIEKFIRRFRYIEEILEKQGVKIQDSDLKTMNKLWEECKEHVSDNNR
ncbi:MAG: nucleoside triphosphate pyrophosphohydrolase [Eubacteriales bacterium]